MEVYDLKTTLKPSLILLRCIGLWPPHGVLGKNKLYTAYSVLTISCISLHILSQTILLAFIYDDLSMLATATYFLLVEWVAMIKIYYFFNHFADLKGLLAISDDDMFQPKNDYENELLHSAVISWRIGSLAYLIMALPTLFLWYVVPFNRTTYTLPFAAWYPFDYKYSPAYELTFSYQVVSCGLLSLVNLNFDMFGAGLMTCLTGQCDLLSHRLRNMGKIDKHQMPVLEYNAETQNGHHSNSVMCKFSSAKKHNIVDVFSSFEDATFNTTLHMELQVNIQHHKLMLRFAEGVSNYFKVNALGVFGSDIIAITMALFQMSMISFDSLEFYLLIVYLIEIFLQLLMYCWYGNDVVETSSKISYAAFESNWVDGSEDFKKDLLFFIFRSQKVIKITAVDIFELSLQVYVSIVKTAFSYFAVLRQVYNDD